MNYDGIHKPMGNLANLVGAFLEVLLLFIFLRAQVGAKMI